MGRIRYLKQQSVVQFTITQNIFDARMQQLTKRVFLRGVKQIPVRLLFNTC